MWLVLKGHGYVTKHDSDTTRKICESVKLTKSCPPCDGGVYTKQLLGRVKRYTKKGAVYLHEFVSGERRLEYEAWRHPGPHTECHELYYFKMDGTHRGGGRRGR